MQSVYTSYLSKFLKKLITNNKTEDINYSMKSGLLELNEVEFNCDFFNSFAFSNSPHLRIVSAKSSYIKLKIPSIIKLGRESLILYLGIVDIKVSSCESPKPSSETGEKDSYGFSQKIIDAMKVKIESVHISVTIESSKRVKSFIFKLFFFNSLLFATDENFQVKGDLNTKRGDFFLLHRMLRSKFACAELYYQLKGDETMRHIVLFNNQSLVAKMIVKKNRNNKKLAVINALEIDDVIVKMGVGEFSVLKEFIWAMVDENPPRKKTESVTKNPPENEFGRENASNFPRTLFNGSNGFVSPPFVNSSPVEFKFELFSSSISIKSLLLYLTPDIENHKGNGNSGLEGENDLDSLRKETGYKSENRKKIEFFYKVFLEGLTMGNLRLKERSFFDRKTENKFDEIVTGLTLKDAAFFYNTGECSECLFSTFGRDQKGKRKESFLPKIDYFHPIHFWEMDVENYISCKIYSHRPQPVNGGHRKMWDIRMGKTNVLFELSKWSEIINHLKELLKGKLSYIGLDNVFELEKEEFIDRTKNVLDDLKGKLREGKTKIPSKIKKLLKENLFRFSSDGISIELKKDEIFSQISAGKFHFCNEDLLWENTTERNFVCSRIDFRREEDFNSLEIFLNEISVSIGCSSFYLNKYQLGIYCGEEMRFVTCSLGDSVIEWDFKSIKEKSSDLKTYYTRLIPYGIKIIRMAKESEMFRTAQNVLSELSKLKESQFDLKGESKRSFQKRTEEMCEFCKKFPALISRILTKIKSREEISTVKAENRFFLNFKNVKLRHNHNEIVEFTIRDGFIYFIKANGHHSGRLIMNEIETKKDQEENKHKSFILHVENNHNGSLQGDFSVTLKNENGPFERGLAKRKNHSWIELPLRKNQLEERLEKQEEQIINQKIELETYKRQLEIAFDHVNEQTICSKNK